MKIQCVPTNNNSKSVKIFFILGRNPKLSRAEILSYLDARNRTYKEIYFEENILILEVPKDEKFNIQEFGGTLQIGKINFKGNESELEIYLKQNEIIPSDKFSYSTFGNLDPSPLKNKFKNEKKKATLKHGRKLLKFQDGKSQELPKANFNILFHKIKNIYLGTTTQNYDHNQDKKLDMNKPEKREHLAISPRLSKILINLSGAKPHDLLLDPFCGVGGIVQEALLKQINTHGIDKDKLATTNAEKNLKWLSSNYNIQTKYKIQNLDSRKTPDLQFAAIATETPLGRILRKKPNNSEAKQIIQNFESFIIPILIRLKKVKKPAAKIAITFPAINNLRVNTQKIANKTNLKITRPPILEFRPDQYISRDILVFQ